MVQEKILGLTSAVGADVKVYKELFQKQNYSLFDVNAIEWALRSEDISTLKSFFKNNFFKENLIEQKLRNISTKTITKLNSSFPNLYVEGEFRREKLIELLNDDEKGKTNYEIYNQIIAPVTKELFNMWAEDVHGKKCLSSCLIVERNYLPLIDELYMIMIHKEDQIESLYLKNKSKNPNYTKNDALKAIKRQYSSQEKYDLAKEYLGKKNVHKLFNLVLL